MCELLDHFVLKLYNFEDDFIDFIGDIFIFLRNILFLYLLFYFWIICGFIRELC